MAVGYCNGTNTSSENRRSAEISDKSTFTTLNPTAKTTKGLVLKEIPSETGLISPDLLPAAHKGLNLEMRRVLSHNDFQQTIKFINKKRRESGKAELSDSERAYVESEHIFKEWERYCAGENKQHKKVKGHKKHHHSKNKTTVRNENFSPKYLDFSKIPTSYTVKPLFSPLDARKAACELVKNGIEWWTGVVDRSYPVYGYANPGKGYLQNLWTGHLNEEVSARKGPETRTSEEKTHAKENIPAMVDSHKKVDLDSSKHEGIQGKNHLLPMAKSNDGPGYSIPGLRDLGNYVSYLPLGISGAFATLSSSLSGKALGVLGLVASQSKSTQAAQLDIEPITEKPDLPLARESSALTSEELYKVTGLNKDDMLWLHAQGFTQSETQAIAEQVIAMLKAYAESENDQISQERSKRNAPEDLSDIFKYIDTHGVPNTAEETEQYQKVVAAHEQKRVSEAAKIVAKAAIGAGGVTKEHLMSIFRPQEFPEHTIDMLHRHIPHTKNSETHKHVELLDKCGLMEMLSPILMVEDAIEDLGQHIANLINAKGLAEDVKLQMRKDYLDAFRAKVTQDLTTWEAFSMGFREGFAGGVASAALWFKNMDDVKAGAYRSSMSVEEIEGWELGKNIWRQASQLVPGVAAINSFMELEAAIEQGKAGICDYLRTGVVIGMTALGAGEAEPGPRIISEEHQAMVDNLGTHFKDALYEAGVIEAQARAEEMAAGTSNPYEYKITTTNGERTVKIRHFGNEREYTLRAEHGSDGHIYELIDKKTGKLHHGKFYINFRGNLERAGLVGGSPLTETDITALKSDAHYQLELKAAKSRLKINIIKHTLNSLETKLSTYQKEIERIQNDLTTIEISSDPALKEINENQLQTLKEKIANIQREYNTANQSKVSYLNRNSISSLDSLTAQEETRDSARAELVEKHRARSEEIKTLLEKEITNHDSAVKAEQDALNGYGKAVENWRRAEEASKADPSNPFKLQETEKLNKKVEEARANFSKCQENFYSTRNELERAKHQLGGDPVELEERRINDMEKVAKSEVLKADTEKYLMKETFMSRFEDGAKSEAGKHFERLAEILENSEMDGVPWQPRGIQQIMIDQGYNIGRGVSLSRLGTSEIYSAPTVFIPNGAIELEFVVDGEISRYAPEAMNSFALVPVERWQRIVCEHLDIDPENSTLVRRLPEEEALSQGGKKSRKSKNQSDNHGQSAAKRTKSSEKTGADIADVENDDQGINSQPDQIEQAGTNTGGSGSALTLEQIDKARGQLYSERNQLNKLESTIQNKRQRLEQAKKFKSEQEALVKRLEKDNNPNNRESRRLQKKAANANIRRQARLIPQLTNEIKDLQSKLASRDGKLHEIQERLDELSIMSEKLPNRNMRPKSVKNLELFNLATERRMLIEADTKLAEIESDINQRKLEIEKNYKKVADINKTLKTKSGQERKSLTDERAKLTNTITKNRSIITKKDQEVARLKNLILSRDTRLREIAEREVELGKTTAISPEKIKSLEEEISKLSHEINTLREERLELDRIKSKRKLTKDEQFRYKKSRDGIANKNTQIENKRKEISNIKEKLDLIASEIEAAGKSVREKTWANKEISLANAKLLKVKRKIETLKKEIARQKRLRNSTRANELKSELRILEQEKSNIEIRKRDIRGKKITAPDASSAGGGLSASANRRIQQSQRMMSLQIEERISTVQEEVLRSQLASAQNSMAREQIIDLLDEVQIQTERNVIEIEEIIHQQLQDESRELLSMEMDGDGIPEPDLSALERERIEQLQIQANSLESIIQSQQGNAFEQAISDNGYEGIFSLPESAIPELQKIINTFVDYTQEIFSTLDETDVFDKDDLTHINQRVQEQSSKLTTGVKMAEVAKKAIDNAMEALEEARNNLLIKRRQSRQSSSAIQATNIRKQLTIRQKEYARIRRNFLTQKRKLSISMEKVALNIQRSATDVMGLAKIVQKDSIRKLVTLSDEIRGFVAQDNEYQPFNIDDNSGFMDIESANTEHNQQNPELTDIHEPNTDIESNNQLLNQITSIAQEENNQQLIEEASTLEEIERSQEQKTLEEQLKTLEQELISLRGQYDQLSQLSNPSQQLAADAVFSEIEGRETQCEVSSLAHESIDTSLILNLEGIPTELVDEITKARYEVEEKSRIASNFRRQAEIGRRQMQSLREEITTSLTDLLNRETQQALRSLRSDISMSAMDDSTLSQTIDSSINLFNQELNKKLNREKLANDFKLSIKTSVMNLIEEQRKQADSGRDAAIARYQKVQEEFIQRYLSESTNPQAASVEAKHIAQDAINLMKAELLRQNIETERQILEAENQRTEHEKILEMKSSYPDLIKQSLTTLQEAAEKLKEAKRKK